MRLVFFIAAIVVMGVFACVDGGISAFSNKRRYAHWMRP